MGGEGVGCGRRQGDTHVPGAPLQGLPSARAPAVPLAPAPPGCGGFAPALRAPGSGVRFFVPAHARPILTDRVRGLPVANRCARPAFPAPWGPRSTAPLSVHVVQACAAGRLFGVQHLGACSAIAGPRSRPVCVLASSRSSLPALRPLLGVPGPRRRSPVYQRGRARGSIRQGNGRGFGARRSYSYPVRYRRYHNPDCFREGEGRKGAAELFVPKNV